MDFLNKLYTKAIFSADDSLNVTAYDLGEDMISAQIAEPPVNRLATAVGTVGSLNIMCPVDVTIAVLKTSPIVSNFYNRLLTNGYVGGTLTLYDDVNQSFTLEDVSVSLNEVPNANGTQPAINFLVQGNLLVNKDALSVV